MEFKTIINRKAINEIQKATLNKVSKYVPFLIAFLSFLITLLFTVYKWDTFCAITFSLLTVFSVLGSILGNVWRSNIMYRGLTRTNAPQYTQVICFDDDCIHLKSTTNHTVLDLKYSIFRKIISSKHYFIFISKGMMLILINRADISPENAEQFIRLLTKKMPKIKIPRTLKQKI